MLTHCWLKQYIASIIHVINVPEWYIELCCGAITKTWQLLSCCLVNHQVWNVSYIKRLKTYPKQNEDCCKYKKSEVKLNIPVLLHYIAYAVEHGFPELCGSPTRLRIKHILQGPTNQKKKKIPLQRTIWIQYQIYIQLLYSNTFDSSRDTFYSTTFPSWWSLLRADLGQTLALGLHSSQLRQMHEVTQWDNITLKW